jgi:hypothetical protein
MVDLVENPILVSSCWIVKLFFDLVALDEVGMSAALLVVIFLEASVCPTKHNRNINQHNIHVYGYSTLSKGHNQEMSDAKGHIHSIREKSSIVLSNI